jgi:aspartate racemase
MHRVADAIEAAVSVPLLHIADVAAQAVTSSGVRTIGLLGTRFTMEQPFYIERLAAAGLEVLVPESDDRAIVHDIIYTELVQGIVTAESCTAYRAVIDRLVQRGAGGIVLGCTEIELLVTSDDSAVPVFATTRLHARTAADWAIAESAEVGSAGVESA